MFAEHRFDAGRLTLAVAVALGTVSMPAHQARDARVQTSAGTATVAGVVVDDSPTPRPLRRALVTITGDDLPVGRSAITDDDGRFSIQRLPAARVMIAATKAGYVAGAHGAARPGRPGTPAVLRAGASLDTTIRLTRTAVVTGVIRDDYGEPLPGVRVFAIGAAKPEPPRPTGDESSRTAETDDRGRYRIHSLVPGEYVVAAIGTVTATGNVTRRSVAESDAMLAWLKQRGPTGVSAQDEPLDNPAAVAPAPSYYPGTPVLRSAGRITLGPGDIRDGLDFVVAAVAVTTIEGTVVAQGGLPASVELSITAPDSLRFFALGGGTPQLTHRPGTDGRFKYSAILPGRYVITARGNPVAPAGGRGGGAAGDETLPGLLRGGNLPETLYAVAEVEVLGQPLAGVTLTLRRGAHVAGKVIVDAMPAASLDLSAATVALQPPPGSGSTGSAGGTLIGNMFGRPAPVAVRADGSFEIAGVAPGHYVVQLTLPPALNKTWWLRSAISDSQDLLDTGLTVTADSDIAGLTLTTTNRRSEIAGVLQAAEGQPAPDYFIIVMPARADEWRAQSRRVRTTRPASDGSFSFVNLPAGDYLLVALTDVEPDEWQKPEFLASIAPAGVKVTLADGERKRQDLRIGRR